MPEVPIGTIIAWVLKVDKSSNGNISDLPDGWMCCDGGVIPSKSMWAGKRVPDLNGERRFLRGGDDKDMLKLEDDQLLEHTHNIADSGHHHGYTDTHYTTILGPAALSLPDYLNAHKVKQIVPQPTTQQTASAHSGITGGGINSGHHGNENRPKNMAIIWIIRVW